MTWNLVSLSLYIYIYIYIYILAQKYICAHTLIYIYIYIHGYIYIYAHIYIHMRTHRHIYIYIYIFFFWIWNERRPHLRQWVWDLSFLLPKLDVPFVISTPAKKCVVLLFSLLWNHSWIFCIQVLSASYVQYQLFSSFWILRSSCTSFYEQLGSHKMHIFFSGYGMNDIHISDNVCIYIYIHTYTHIYIHIYIYAYKYIYIHTHTHTYIYICLSVY